MNLLIVKHAVGCKARVGSANAGNRLHQYVNALGGR